MSAVKKLMQNMVNTLAPFVKSDLIDEVTELEKQKKELNDEIQQLNSNIDYKKKEIINLDIEDREFKKHIRRCNWVLENELEPKVYEFYCEELRNAMRKREEETLKYLQQKLNK